MLYDFNIENRLGSIGSKIIIDWLFTDITRYTGNSLLYIIQGLWGGEL